MSRRPNIHGLDKAKLPESDHLSKKNAPRCPFSGRQRNTDFVIKKNNCHKLLNNKKNAQVKGLGTPLAKTEYHNDEWFSGNRKHHHGLRFILPVMTQYPPGNRKRVNHEQTAPNLIEES
jgi:outer membrane protein assembly factor BamE (lipoprotein component of BamABCDE complex)